MMRLLAIVWCLVAASVAGGQSATEPPDVRQVTVTAEGYSKDDAIKQALRKALEKGAGLQLASYSQVEDFALVRDTIYSRAAGIVADYRVTRGPDEIAGGFWEVTIAATVRPDAVAAAWGEVQNVLDQIGRPKIMVVIDERIDERLQDDSIVASRLEQMFLKAGFELVHPKAVAALRAREAADAEDERDAARLARIAKDAGAHVLVHGWARADRSGMRDVYGTPVAYYTCAVQASVYYTDTAQLLASESIPARERGLRSQRSFNPQAARAALVAATFPDSDVRREPVLATKLFEAVMEQWSTIITAGHQIVLEVEGLSFKQYVELHEALRELRRVDSVTGDFTKGAGTFRIKAKVDASTLAEQLLKAPFEKWVEVTDLKPNRIQARRVAQY